MLTLRDAFLAAREANLRRLVFASSAAAYGDADRLPLVEESPTRALSPDAASKIAGETHVRAFVASYGLLAVILRYFNVCGPRQDPTSPYSGVISKFAAALGRGEVSTIFGDGHQKWSKTSEVSSRCFCSPAILAGQKAQPALQWRGAFAGTLG